MKAFPKKPQTRTRGKASKSEGVLLLPTPIREILVPVDFSAVSAQSLVVAVQWAKRFAARLHLLYVVEPPALPRWGYAFLALREKTLRTKAEKQLKKLRQRVHSPVVVTTEVRSGFEAEYEICQLARQRRTSLIVIGSHGAGPLRRAFLGSTAERLLRHATCPVLVLREGFHLKTRRQ